MSPSNANPDTTFDEDPLAVAEERAALEAIARNHPIVAEPGAAGEEEDEEDEDEDDDLDDEDDDEDEDDDDDEDDDEDDDDDTSARANQTLKSGGGISDDDGDIEAAPDAPSDRVPATDAEPEGSLAKAKVAPLGIQEIENLEEDARGG